MKDSMPRIAVVIITRNEEGRIRQALGSVRGLAGEIVVVDDMSTDNSCAIAEKEFGARIFRRSSGTDLASQRNFGADQAESPWILIMDADEVVPKETVQRIREAVNAAGDEAAFEVRRLNHFIGHPIRRAGAYGFRKQIYRKDKARFQEPDVHERLVVNGSVGQIEADILHYPFETVSPMFEKAIIYGEYEAERFCRENARISAWEVCDKLTRRAFKNFLKLYYRKHGFEDGMLGFVWCVCNVIGPQIKWVKIWEKATRSGQLTWALRKSRAV